MPDCYCQIFNQYYQERQQLVAEVQQKVDRLKREQKKRDDLAAKIKASFQSLIIIAGGETLPIFRRWRASSWWVGGASLTTPTSSRRNWTSSNRKWLVRRWVDHVTVM